MKTVNENWKELFEDSLTLQEMLRVRGGGDPGNGDPSDPIIK
jgi:hypothetical protein